MKNTATEPAGITFTPYENKQSKERVRMRISFEDRIKFNTLPKGNTGAMVQIFDKVTQKHYIVKRADCGLNCFCAAVIVQDLTQPQKLEFVDKFLDN